MHLCLVTRNEVVELAARLAHEANRAYCRSIGDTSQPAWDDAPEWQQTSAKMGVLHRLENPDAAPEDSHKSWLAVKEAEGWIWGPVKDPELKQHPCMVPYEQLPSEQRAKDYIFLAVTGTLLSVAQLQTEGSGA